jgi:hypothetical protein
VTRFAVVAGVFWCFSGIYREKGFKDELLDEIVRVITSRRKVWIDTMMKEELA